MDKLFRICKSECGMEFGKVPEVEEGGLAEIFDVSFKDLMRVHFNTRDKIRGVGCPVWEPRGLIFTFCRRCGSVGMFKTRQRFSSGIVIYSGRTLGLTSSDKVPEAVKHQQQLQSSALCRTSRQVIN
ncbi:hypothetical protein ATANTOWER_015680 [Ataeniobius toweri]|uniref:Uncharacterized protein n=1 Tax=Ataeniobius toweri TaxID=208326 RepID=A0ABU7BPX5_9TELE|nr:hypothetical protein [Ataeniobius toweri]